MLHGLPHTFGDLRVIAHLTRGAGWPRGGWLLAALPDLARRNLLSEGYEVTEDRDGRIIVEPPVLLAGDCMGEERRAEGRFQWT